MTLYIARRICVYGGHSVCAASRTHDISFCERCSVRIPAKVAHNFSLIYLSTRCSVVLQRPLLDGSRDLAQVVNAGIRLRSGACPHKVRDGNGGQQADDGHHDHDFHQGERTRATIGFQFHSCAAFLFHAARTGQPAGCIPSGRFCSLHCRLQPHPTHEQTGCQPLQDLVRPRFVRNPAVFEHIRQSNARARVSNGTRFPDTPCPVSGQSRHARAGRRCPTFPPGTGHRQGADRSETPRTRAGRHRRRTIIMPIRTGRPDERTPGSNFCVTRRAASV